MANKNFSPKSNKIIDLREKEIDNVLGGNELSPKRFKAAKAVPPRAKIVQPSATGSRRRRPAIYIFLALLILLIGATVASFFMFNKDSGSKDSIKLSLVSPDSLASGEEFTFKLLYENRDKIAMQKIEAVIQYPEGFFFDRANLKPSGQNNNIWQLPDLEPGQGGKIEITGQLMGKIDELKNFKVTFYYQPANFNSTFKSELETTIKISNVLFQVSFEKPTAMSPGADSEFKVKYQNTTDNVMDDIVVSLDLGNDFTLTKATPTSTGNLIWNLEKVGAKQEGEIVFSGKFGKDSVGDLPWLFKVWQNIVREGKKQQRLLYQEEGTIKITAPLLKVNLENPSGDQINWGENFNYKIVVQNDGQVQFNDTSVKLELGSSLIDWDEFESDEASVEDGNLIWTFEDLDELKEIKAGQKVELEAVLPIISEPDDVDLLSPEELMIQAKATLTGKSGEQEYTFSSDTKTNFVAAAPQFNAEARYYLDRDTAVGSGPLPPEVGKETTYRVYWKVFSGTKGVDQVVIKANLPPYMRYVREADHPTVASSFSYNETNREVIWQIDSLALNSQTQVSFDLAVIPDESQVGQILILTNPTLFSAKERTSNEDITVTISTLTSELTADALARNKGKVIEVQSAP